MVPVHVFVEKLLSREGNRYVFGHEVTLSDTDPAAFDCSELIEWAAYQVGVEPKVPDGSWIQARHAAQHGTLISIPNGLSTRGALLFRFSSDPFRGARPSSSHVAVSLGDGRTIEARGSRYGVGIFTADGRGWTHAALVPGIDYSKQEPEDLPQEEVGMTFAQIQSMIFSQITDDQIDALFASGAAQGDASYFKRNRAQGGIRDVPESPDWSSLTRAVLVAGWINLATKTG